MNRRAAALVAMLIAAVLAGCEADVATTMTLSGSDTVEVSVEVALTGSAARAFSSDVELLNRLKNLVEDRAAAPAKRSVDEEQVTFWVQVAPEQLAAMSTLTGVGTPTVTTRDTASEVTVPLMSPTELTSALADTPDEHAVPLLLENTTVTVTLRAAKIISVSGPVSNPAAGVFVEQTDDTVTVTRSVASDTQGTLVVVAEPVSSGPPWLMFAAVALLAAGVAVWVRRH